MQLMSGKCKITRDNILALENNDRVSDEAYKAMSNFLDINESLSMDLQEEWKIGETVDDEKLLDKKIMEIIERKYGKKSERILLAHKIYAIIQGTSISEDMMYEFILTHLPHGLKVGKKTGKVDPDTGLEIREGLDLTLFPMSSLKLFLAQALRVVTAVNPDRAAYANFGGIWSSIKTPSSLKWEEPTGAFYDLSKNVRDYSRFVSSRINMFMDNVDELKAWVRKYNKGKKKEDKLVIPEMAMNDILENLNSFTAVRQGRASDRDMQRLFHMYMMGWMYLDPDTQQFMIHEDWGRQLNEEGYAKRWPPTPEAIAEYEEKKKKGLPADYPEGDIMKGFSSPVPLSKYQDGKWNVVLNKKDFKRFMHLAEQARNVDNVVFEYMAEQFQESVDTLIGTLSEQFKNLTEDQIKLLFFHPNSNQAKKIFSAIDDKSRRKIKLLKDTFGMYISDELVIANGAKVEKKSRHWPIIYDTNVYKMLVDMYIQDMEYVITTLQDKIDKHTGTAAAKRKLIREKEIHEDKLSNASEIRNNFDKYHKDYQSNSLIPFSQDNKYFKRISGAFDIRSGRNDVGVYYDYLKHIMSAIERNHLSSTLAHNLDIAESEAVIRTMINLFKVPFGDPTTEGFMGMTVEGQAGFINSITPDFLYTLSAKEHQENMRRFAGWLTGVYLSGAGSPLTNMTAMMENIYDFGKDVFQEALQDYNSTTKIPGRNITVGEAIKSIIQRSGITEFSDFFSRAMVNGIIGIQLEQDIADRILGEMMLFHEATKKSIWADFKRTVRGNKKKSELDAYDNFVERVTILLEQSSIFIDNVEKLVLLEEDRVNFRRKRIKREKKEAAINKLIQYAINKEYVFKTALKDVPISKFRKNVGGPISDLALTVGQLYGQITKFQFGLTMSDTEAALRSISFVIGVNRAWLHGALPNHVHWWEYTAEEDIQKVITIGSEYNYFVNFGLSTQDVGRYNWNGFGNLMGKFKYWSQQKWGKDSRRFRWAYESLKDVEDVENQNFSMKAVVKLLGHLFDPRVSRTKGRARRATHPELQAFRVWFWSQGLATALWDQFVRGPFKIPFLTNFVYGKMGFGGQIRNFGSDLLSWIFLFPAMLARGAFMSDEPIEDEDIQRQVTHYIRKWHLGYLPMMGFDFILSMIYGLNEQYKKMVDKFPVPIYPEAEQIIKDILKEVGDLEDY
tara:strand:+ start:3634 stop:7176 length:3543 start_codon:yes stop_codon:yes gene_type:complete